MTRPEIELQTNLHKQACAKQAEKMRLRELLVRFQVRSEMAVSDKGGSPALQNCDSQQ